MGCIRLWDTCIAETVLNGPGKGFSIFLANVCVSFLSFYKSGLREAGFDELMAFMVKPPTSQISAQDLETCISEAFVLSSQTTSAAEEDETGRPSVEEAD